MRNGFVLLAFGKPIYGAMAYNMALSIKYHNPNIPIHLVYEDQAMTYLTERHYQYFDSFQLLNKEDLYDGETLNPGKMKVSVYDYLPYKYNLYLDVDGAALCDLQPLIDRLIKGGQFIYSQSLGNHTIDKGREIKIMLWAWADDIWEHYKFDDDTKLPATNSSFLFIHKCPKAKAFYKKLKDNFLKNPLPLKKLRYKWGGTYPDELALNVTFAQQDLDPSPGFKPVYFNQDAIRDFKELEGYYVLGLFGGVGYSSISVWKYYDRLMQKYSLELLNQNHKFKSHMLMKSKHANKRK